MAKWKKKKTTFKDLIDEESRKIQQSPAIDQPATATTTGASILDREFSPASIGEATVAVSYFF